MYVYKSVCLYIYCIYKLVFLPLHCKLMAVVNFTVSSLAYRIFKRNSKVEK